jgi:hypothetical protein
MNAPTYKEFRAWAYVNTYTPETLAPCVQADNPLKAAERILAHLAGTRFDDEPLPYQKLCQLYHGATLEQTTKKRKLRAFNQIPPAELPPEALDAPPLHGTWLLMFEAGWSIEKIASVWNQPIESVEATLDKLSQWPLPPEQQRLALPGSEEEGKKYHEILRELHRRGWSEAALLRLTGCHTPESLSAILRLPAKTRKSRVKLDPRRICPCGCKKRLKGRQQYASDACRKKVTRHRNRTVA